MSWRTCMLSWCVGAAIGLAVTSEAQAQCEPVQNIADGEGSMDELKFVLINQTFPGGSQADGVQGAIPDALTNAVGQWDGCNEGPPISEDSGGWEIYTIAASKQDENGDWICGERDPSEEELLIYANSPGCTAAAMKNVLLHEIGHVLGLGHTTCEGKVMYNEVQEGVIERDSEACQVLNRIYETPEEEEEDPNPCPLVLDLNWDGIGTTNVELSPVYFDLDADGAVDELGWIAARTPDAFLWLDLNANDVVDDGAELFGNHTLLPNGEKAENGFEALAQYDLPAAGGNGDGRITSDDAVWSRLALWNDWDHDGQTIASETMPLSESGVTALSLRYAPREWIDDQGNIHRGVGRFWAHGASERGRATGHVEDLWFAIIR